MLQRCSTAPSSVQPNEAAVGQLAPGVQDVGRRRVGPRRGDELPALVDLPEHREVDDLPPLAERARLDLADEVGVAPASMDDQQAHTLPPPTCLRAARLPVPVASSALLQLPLVETTLPQGKRAGVITFNAQTLGAPHLGGVGARLDTPIVGLAHDDRFRRALHGDASVDGYGYREAEAIEAADRLVRAHRDVGAIVLECTTPCRTRAIRDAVRLPVYDVMTLVDWFYAGCTCRA